MISRILFLIYDFIFFILFILYLPIYIWRKKINFRAFREKFGFIPRIDKESIWIQVVSVGEVNLIGELIKKLKEILNYEIVISTTTLTGNRVAKKKYSSFAKIIFFPFDISIVLRRVLGIINPKIFIAAETELWPNLYHRLKNKGIPIMIVNGRISDEAFRGYRRVRPIIRSILNECDYIGVQNSLYQERFLSLGAAPEKVSVTGNMKFESVSIDESHLVEVKNKFASILKDKDRILIIAGSTHNPEEEGIVKIFQELVDKGLDLSLLLAPRHIERVSALERVASSHGFVPVRLSKIDAYSNEKKCIFLLDSVGELLYFYALADICFVGGSLIAHGGQNILEPIYFLKPTCFGPHMDNFKDIEEVVLAKGAAIRVQNLDDLKDKLLALVRDESLRANLRLNCLKVFEEERKGSQKTLEMILSCIK